MVLDGKTFADATMVIALGITISRFLGFVRAAGPFSRDAILARTASAVRSGTPLSGISARTWWLAKREQAWRQRLVDTERASARVEDRNQSAADWRKGWTRP